MSQGTVHQSWGPTALGLLRRPFDLPYLVPDPHRLPRGALALPLAEDLPPFSFLTPAHIHPGPSDIPGTLVDPPSLWGLLSLLPVVSPEEGATRLNSCSSRLSWSAFGSGPCQTPEAKGE